MAKLLGREYKKDELLRYAGNLSHIAGVERIEYEEGKAKGVSALEVRTGSGLEFVLLTDKCLDIARLRYKGVTISQASKNGLTGPGYGLPIPGEFGRTVSGGMLFTAGLLNAGPDCVDTDGKYHHVHGNIGVTPAEGLCAEAAWQGDDYVIAASGMMRESALFGHNLTLKRTVKTKLGSNELELTDILENAAPEDEEICILYHFNLGFPFLSESTKLFFPGGLVHPRTPEAKAGLSECDLVSAPVDGFFEHVFFRDPETDENGWCTVRAENPMLGLGMYISYEKRNLPVLVQWKSMRSGDYALGIEPANCYIKGRRQERESGAIARVKGFGSLEYRLRVGVYEL